jgi:hypothetical protein
MPISLTSGSGDPIPCNTLTDLKHPETTFLKLGEEFGQYIRQPISSLPDNLKTSSIQYTSGNQSWKFETFTFTLSGGVSGKISIITSGDLLTYTDGFQAEVVLGLSTTKNSNSSKKISVPAGSAYLRVQLDFQFQGGLSGSYKSGIYGVSGSIDTKDNFTVAFYKKCKPTDILSDAISAAISGFVLPLHATTLKNLQVGDYLQHNFNANLQLGLGANIGYNKVFYAGQYKGDIPATANAVALKTSTKPEIQVGAKLAFKFDYSGTFEALLWLETAHQAHLHLYRSNQQDTSLDLNVGITLNANAVLSSSVMTDQFGSSLTQLLPHNSVPHSRTMSCPKHHRKSLLT